MSMGDVVTRCHMSSGLTIVGDLLNNAILSQCGHMIFCFIIMLFSNETAQSSSLSENYLSLLKTFHNFCYTFSLNQQSTFFSQIHFLNDLLIIVWNISSYYVT